MVSRDGDTWEEMPATKQGNILHHDADWGTMFGIVGHNPPRSLAWEGCW